MPDPSAGWVSRVFEDEPDLRGIGEQELADYWGGLGAEGALEVTELD
jgi:hypothetical protein